MAKFKSTASVISAVPQMVALTRALLYFFSFVVLDVPVVATVFGVQVPGWYLFVFLYGSSFGLDQFDGFIARSLDQTSELGGVLDMALDRCGTAVLLTFVASAYPAYRLVFAYIMVLDVASHWLHVTSALLMPVRGHHKSSETLKKRSALLRLYYGNRIFFGYCCIGAEVFYMGMLCLAYGPGTRVSVEVPVLRVILSLSLWQFTWFAAFPGCVVKNVINVSQFCSGILAIAAVDVEESSSKRAQ